MKEYNHEIDERDALVQPLAKTGKGFYLTAAPLAIIVLIGLFAWIRQIVLGLGVTGMNTPVYWGLYITNFVFFIGISHAGTLISAILRVSNAEWRRPVTRAAEAITVFALIFGASQIIFDMGRPDRVLNAIWFGRFQSPLTWDVLCISIYLLSCIAYLYVPLIPDLGILRDKLTNISGWRRRLYSVLSLGWQGTSEQRRRLEKVIGVMAIAIIPIAVSVHTVVSWVFAMTLKPMWHSTIFGPYFVIGAIYSGIAAIIIAMAILRKTFRLENYLKPVHFNYLGILLLVLCAAWFYFTFAEYLTTGYGSVPAEMRVFNAKLTGEYMAVFWGMVAFMVIAFFTLAFKRTRTINGVVFASVLVVLGMWLERFTIVVPTGTRPMLEGYAIGVYHPTLTEWAITAASFAGFALLYVLFAKLFPIISIWEIQESREAISETVERLEGYLPEKEVEIAVPTRVSAEQRGNG